MPPQVNATVTKVAAATGGAGGRDNWDETLAAGAPDEPAGAGAQKWAGTVAAFLEEKVDRVPGPNGVDVLERRRLHVDAADARAIGVDTDDVVTFTDPAGVQRTARVIVAAYAELAGIPAELQTTRLELEPA